MNGCRRCHEGGPCQDYAAIAEIERLTAALAEAEAEELRLRRLLCAVYAGTAAYMDDGEASLGDRMPFIDFLRMPVAEIEAAMHQRAIDAAKEKP